MIDNVVEIINYYLNPSSPCTRTSYLLGHMPEFDSMSVVTILTAVEDELGLTMEDDDITAEDFKDVASLALALETKAHAV